MSKRAILKAEAARKQAALLEQKKNKIEEERERAAGNARKKKERAEKRNMEERAKGQARQEGAKIGGVEEIGQEGLRPLETEERRAAEDEAQIQVEESRGQEEACQQDQEALRQPQQQEGDTRKRDQESRKRAQQEEKRCLEEEACLRHEQEALRQTRQTEEARDPEQESRRKAEEDCPSGQKAPGNQSQQRGELVNVQSHVDAPRGEQREDGRQGLGNRPVDQHKRRLPRKRVPEDLEAKRAEGLRRLRGQAEDYRRQVGKSLPLIGFISHLVS